MKLSVIQPDILWEDVALNMSNLESMIFPLFGKSDMIILPEMFTTGFTMNARKLSEPPDGNTFHWMRKLSKLGNLGICGSYIVRENELLYNRWVFAGPDGETWSYDKHHLFTMSGEDTCFTSGNSRLVFSFRGFRICPYICYDLRFPVWNRNKNDADLIIYSANWPTARRNVWNILLRARAIENQCYVAASNRIGTDGMGINYSGESALIDPKGEIITLADPGIEHSITAEISLDELNDFRKKFPVLEDADEFFLR